MNTAIKNLTAIPFMLLFTASAFVVLVFSAILMSAETIISGVFFSPKPSKSRKESRKKGIIQGNVPCKELT